MNEHITGIDHRHNVLDWLIDIGELFRLLIVLETNMSGGTLGKGAMEIWVLDSSFGLPGSFLFVGKDTSGHGGAIVST